MEAFSPVRNPVYSYTHGGVPKYEFWYPIPLGTVHEPSSAPSGLLLCRTQRGWLRLAETIPVPPQWDHIAIYASLRNERNEWFGALSIGSLYDSDNHDPRSEKHRSKNIPISQDDHSVCELIALSRGSVHEELKEYLWPIEWLLGEHPRLGDEYEFYNVM
jgi:hypothetical protein